MIHSLLWIVFLLVIAGILLWAVQAAPVLDATVKQIIRILIIVIISIYVVYIIFGMLMGHPPVYPW